MKDKKNIQQKHTIWAAFIVIVLIQLSCIIYDFQVNKEGFHSDELWSYGFANSYNEPYIYKDDNDEVKNVNEWLSGDVLVDYLVVNEGEAFRYDVVYNNQNKDLSPPLHSMLLHTICSFFPETFSAWYSFAINIVAFIILMIYLFKLAAVLENDKFALYVSILYGFTWAARDTFIYLRAYALNTALLMVVIYHVVRYLKSLQTETVSYRHLLYAAIVAFLAFYNHLYMITSVGIFTFLVCVYLLFQKKWKHMLIYGFSMLGSLIVMIMTYPTILQVITKRTGEVSSEIEALMNYNFEMRFKIMLNFLLFKMFNIPVSVYTSGVLKIAIGVAVTVLIVCLPLLYLLRHNKWIVKIRERMVTWLQSPIKHTICLLKKLPWIYIIIIVMSLVQCIIVQETTSLYGMAENQDRYIMYLYPLFFIAVIGCVVSLIKCICKNQRVFVGLLFIMAGYLLTINTYNRLHSQSYMFPKYTKMATLSEVVSDTDCIVVNSDPWELVLYAADMMQVNEFFYVSKQDVKDYTEEYQEKVKNGKVIVTIDMTEYNDEEEMIKNKVAGLHVQYEIDDEKDNITFDEVYDYFEALVPNTKMEKVSEDTFFGRTMYTYVINP